MAVILIIIKLEIVTDFEHLEFKGVWILSRNDNHEGGGGDGGDYNGNVLCAVLSRSVMSDPL